MRLQSQFNRNDHLISIADFSSAEIRGVLELAKTLKDAWKEGVRLPLLKNKTLAMIFEISSTRTRISFETAMADLGGHAQFLSMSDLHLGDNHETIRDTAEVISRMVDGVLIRCNEHDTLLEFANYSFAPIINGMTMESHPTQALADIFTMTEHLPDKPLEGITIQYMGDNNAEYDGLIPVQHSLMWISAILGINYIACCPKVMWPCEADVKKFNDLAEINNSNAKLLKTEDPYEYIKDVDFTISDSFWLGYPDGSEDALRRHNLLFPTYRVDQKLVDAGKKTLGVMHCMPGMREEDITTEVWDGPNSLL
ncbi:MAG TPA: ornithine carbamoyltransferase, partial [Bacillota bacterium]|nr:ornithine carbamoyltransferase [Bacillota bacterium]